ncbi:MAG: hypothetical protein CL917_08925, partial [Deltaproteobacteria bacterium]|nr:hypothetical protein [Deltaproteobacteria bacterium]
MTDFWNSEMEPAAASADTAKSLSHSWRVVGASWNRTLEPGGSTSFGFCLDRTTSPESGASPQPSADVSNDSSGESPMPESHNHPDPQGEFMDLASLGLSNGSSHTGHDGLVGGRTAITTEALLAYNDLREFVGLPRTNMDVVGAWAFDHSLTNNTQAWGNDQQGVGLWYAMQGAKVGWIADDRFEPQLLADIQRTARLGSAVDVMEMVADYGHVGFADYLLGNNFDEAFINTLKMEPHYAGWMHDRAHGWLSIEDVAIAHDVNHLTVLSHDQMQPFMNDTWDWPQWPALDVSHAGVLEYFQSMVVLGDPRGEHLSNLDGAASPAPTPDPQPDPQVPSMPPVDDDEGMEDHEGMDDDEGHDHMMPSVPPVSSGNYVDITSWGNFHGSNNNSEHNELVGGRTAITTEAHEAYTHLRAFFGLSEVSIEEVGEWAFSESLTNNSQAWGNDLKGVGLWYAMQGAKVGWISDEAYDPQILADIQRTARTMSNADQMKSVVMGMVREYGHAGFADYLENYGLEDTFIRTLKMEPHYGGWMHGRTHGFRSIEGVAINHDVNHLTVLSWDQMQPFMNDTFDWPQWDALDVSDSGVIEYYQSMVSLGNP